MSTKDDQPEPQLEESTDFYWDGPYMVFTAKYLLDRGFCCQSGCRHCPYGFTKPNSDQTPEKG
jgi:hypothetical protein